MLEINFRHDTYQGSAKIQGLWVKLDPSLDSSPWLEHPNSIIFDGAEPIGLQTKEVVPYELTNGKILCTKYLNLSSRGQCNLAERTDLILGAASSGRVTLEKGARTQWYANQLNYSQLASPTDMKLALTYDPPNYKVAKLTGAFSLNGRTDGIEYVVSGTFAQSLKISLYGQNIEAFRFIATSDGKILSDFNDPVKLSFSNPTLQNLPITLDPSARTPIPNLIVGYCASRGVTDDFRPTASDVIFRKHFITGQASYFVFTDDSDTNYIPKGKKILVTDQEVQEPSSLDCHGSVDVAPFL